MTMAPTKVLDAQLEECVRKFRETGRNKKITIVVVGKTGAGKSHVINSLIGDHVAEEGHTLDAQSMHIARYTTAKHDVKFDIWDTSGLGDVTQNTDEEYLQEIQTIGKIDLVLFCSNMTATRFDHSDKDCITKFSQTFGVEMWQKAMIVLTFANQVCPPPAAPGSTNDSIKDYFSNRKLMFKTKYYKSIEATGVIGDLDLHTHVPVVTAGHFYQTTLPDTEDWLQRLWMEAYKKLEHCSKSAFICANIERLIPDTKLFEHPQSELDECAVFGAERPSVLQYSDDIWSSTVPLESKEPNISSSVAARRKLFENVASNTERSCVRGFGEKKHTLDAPGGYCGGGRRRVQSLTARLEPNFFPETPESKLGKSASLDRPRKQTTATVDQKGTSHASGGKIPAITLNEENERSIVEAIFSFFNYGKAGAQVGEMIGKFFPDYLSAEKGKMGGFVCGQVLALIKEVYLRMNKKDKEALNKNNPQGD